MPVELQVQEDVNQANSEFWNELCGSCFAQELGITDHSEESLRRFDKAYFDFYPYLSRHVKTDEMRGKNVLEIGLGYGTVAQRIAESGANYTGLDIAAGPVNMVNHRMEMFNLPGKAIQGNMLECPIESESMDWVVSIGCFHHTGNMQRCIDETYRVLKPGGKAMIMVYNRFSLRQWQQWPWQTFQALLLDWGLKSSSVKSSYDQIKGYDADLSGQGAPETEFFSINQLRQIFKRFRTIEFHKENCDDFRVRTLAKRQGKWKFKDSRIIPRYKLLNSLGSTLGLDIYLEAQK